MKHLSYPIGLFEMPETVVEATLQSWIDEITNLPQNIKELTDSLSIEKLNWHYRPNGWTIKQVVHHLGDSHLNALTRFKLALTEDNPTIKPYDERLWAELPDSLENNITDSISLLTGLHNRWAKLLQTMSKSDFQRTLTHPEHGRIFTLLEMTGSYAWHCRHHLAHIRQALERNSTNN